MEQRTAITSDAAGLGWWEYDLESGRSVWGCGVVQLLGLDPTAEPLENEWLEVLHPEDKEKVAAGFDRACREHQAFRSEFRVIRPDGEVRWRSSLGQPVQRTGEGWRMFGVDQDITEQKRAEEALRNSQEWLQLAASAARLFAFEYDAVRDWVRREENAPEILGVPWLEETGKAFFARLHPQDRERFEALVKSLCPGNESYRTTYRALRLDGELVVLEESGRGYFDAKGRLTRLVGMAADITARKQAEAVEERLRTLLDHNPSLVFMKDEAGRYVYLNETYEKHFAQSEEWFGKTDFDFWPKESAELFRKDDEEVLRLGGTKQFLEDSRDRAGKRYCWLCYKFPFTASDGKRYIGGVGIDATGQVEAEERVRESEERFRVAQDLSPDGFTILQPVRDAGGRVIDFVWVYQNAAAARFAGRPLELLKGERLLELYPGHRGTAMWETYREVAETGERRVLETFYAGETVTPRWFRLVVVPVTGGIAIHAQDISGQREFQGMLERAVSERTQRLQAAVAELEHFSYTITHDMRAPLRAMRGFSDILISGMGTRFTGPEQDLLHRIKTAAGRMDDLIRDALNYSKTLRMEVELKSLDARAVLLEMLDTYPEYLKERARIRVDGPWPRVLANEAGLVQVFSNLLDNAFKFAAPERLLEIRLCEESRAGRVRIWVIDNGIGIAPEFLGKIWEMFQKLDRSAEGTGVGLALVRKVMERMGGTVGVESEPGKGSRFWVEFAAAEGPGS